MDFRALFFCQIFDTLNLPGFSDHLLIDVDLKTLTLFAPTYLSHHWPEMTPK